MNGVPLTRFAELCEARKAGLFFFLPRWSDLIGPGIMEACQDRFRPWAVF